MLCNNRGDRWVFREKFFWDRDHSLAHLCCNMFNFTSKWNPVWVLVNVVTTVLRQQLETHFTLKSKLYFAWFLNTGYFSQPFLSKCCRLVTGELKLRKLAPDVKKYVTFALISHFVTYKCHGKQSKFRLTKTCNCRDPSMKLKLLW